MVQGSREPELPVKRLPVYLRVLDELIEKGIDLTDSKRLSKETGFTAELIRKDLSSFGSFGARGRGYYTETLRQDIIKVIGLDKYTNVVTVGAGYLGTALTRFNITKNPYIKMVAAFDIDPDRIGEKIIDVDILHISELKDIVARHKVDVAILTVSSDRAQQVFNDIIESGIRVIYNFVPVRLDITEGVHVLSTDLSLELQSLKYFATQLVQTSEKTSNLKIK